MLITSLEAIKDKPPLLVPKSVLVCPVTHYQWKPYHMYHSIVKFNKLFIRSASHHAEIEVAISEVIALDDEEAKAFIYRK